MRPPRLLSLLLLPLVVSFGAGRSTWMPLRVASRWAAVREVEAGREYWLRPECRLESSLPPRDCTSEWLISITFWSPEWLTRVENVLRTTARCTTSTSCNLFPFQTARVGLSDQQAQWAADKFHFVNGPLPSKLQFRLRRRASASPGNCSFDEENLVIEMSDKSQTLGGQKVVNGYEVRAAYRALGRTLSAREVQQDVGAVARRIGQILLRQKAPGAAADQLVRSLTDWADWQGSQARSPWRRNRTQGADVFHQFPLTALLVIQGVTEASTVQRFSVIVQKQGKPDPPDRRAASEKETNELAEVQQRLSDLESYVSQLEFSTNSSNATTPLLSQSLPFQKYRSNVNASNRNSSTDNPYGNRNIRSIDDCTEALIPVSSNLKKFTRKNTKLFYLRPLKRLVRCSENGELVVLQRQKDNIDFNRSWADYRRGFGDAATGDFWIGLDFLANYTATGDACASIEMTPWRMTISDPLIQYADFEVGSEQRNFRLWYTKSNSTLIRDALMESRGQPFSTYDRDRDGFVGNCARMFGGGNWYKSCTRANIFGTLDVNARNTMCWRGIHPSQGDMCSPLTAITMSVRKASQVSKGRTVIFSSIAPNTDNCQCKIKELLINGTGLYHVTAGGAPGGASKTGSYKQRDRGFIRPGGRGAMVRTQRLLRAGTRLRVAAGCRGGTGSRSGHGGDATWIILPGSASKLLLVAGGGGGGGARSRGTHGRAVKSGHKANEVFSSRRATEQRILRKVYTSRGRGWLDLKHRLLKQRNSRSERATSGTQSYFVMNYRRAKNREVPGGGGGGGYEGGDSGSEEAAGGGGGGSFCEGSPSGSCEVTEGGNFHNTGFVIIEKQTCF